MRYAQTLSVYIIYSNEAVYYPSYAGIIRIRSEGIISAAQNKNGTPGYLILIISVRAAPLFPREYLCNTGSWDADAL